MSLVEQNINVILHIILCTEIFRQSNSGFEEYNNFVLKWDGMLPILKNWSDERLGLN